MTAPTVAHLLPDSSFLPFIVDVNEAANPGRNVFMVYGSTAGLERHGLPGEARIDEVDADGADTPAIDAEFARSDVAIVHAMSTLSAAAMISAPSSTLKVWSGWGADYYGNTWNGAAGLLGPASSRWVRRHRRVDRGAMVQRVLSLPHVHRLLGAASRAADVFSAPVPTDLAVFRRRFPQFRGRYHQLNYASVEDTYATEPDSTTGDDILLGNSATPENNHLDVLAVLGELDLGDRRVVIPLSYGDPAYADDVAAAAESLLGSRAVTVRDYLPLAEYNAIIGGCSVMVMGHRRQQALGNVARALWQGAHVLLDRRNTILPFLRAEGFPAVGDLEELLVDGVPTRARASESLAATRAIARRLWSRSTVIENIRGLLP